MKRASTFNKEETNDLNEIEIEVQDIKDALDELDEISAAGPDGIPVMFLIKTKEAIAEPMAKKVNIGITLNNVDQWA